MLACHNAVALSLVIFASAEVSAELAEPVCDLAELIPMEGGGLTVSPDGKVKRDEKSAPVLIPASAKWTQRCAEQPLQTQEVRRRRPSTQEIPNFSESRCSVVSGLSGSSQRSTTRSCV